MEEVKQDVNPVEPSATEQPVEQTAEPTQQTEQTIEAPKPEPTPAPTVSDVDESGVPWKNRAFEWKRKTEDLAEKLPQIVEEKLQSVLSQQNFGQKKYTVEELEAFSTQTDNPYHANWAKQEIRKLERDEQAKVVRDEINRWRKEQDDTVKRQNAYQYVANTYPDVVVKNPAGQIMGWNNQSPLFQQINQVMSDPRFANDPDGLAAAADIAYARISRMQQPQVQKQQQQMKEELKDLQKRTLVEGGSRQTTAPVPAHRVAIEKLKQTGSLRDAQKAMELIFAAKRKSEEQE